MRFNVDINVLTKNRIHGFIRWQCTVKNIKLSFQSWRYIISTSAWMNHGGEHLDILYSREITRLIQRIKTSILHQLTNDLICNLISPFIYFWHIYIVDENAHFSATRGTISGSHSFLHITFENPLNKTLILLTGKVSSI